MKKKLEILLVLGVVVLTGCFDKNETSKSFSSDVTVSATELKQPIRFADKALPSYVKSISGLDAPEAFGRWSTKKMVVIEFTEPLPSKVNVEITAAAFGPNIGAQARVIAGSEAKSFVVNTDTTAAVTNRISFDNTGGDRFMIIEVPFPASPAELGTGQDARKLGLAMVSMQLSPK
jgi:phosphoglycerol transferase